MSLRIKYLDVPQGAQEAALVSGQGQPFSSMALVASGAADVAYATLEPAGWPLDGSRQIMPENLQTGFWSTTTGGADRSVITMEFPQKYTASGISVTFSPGTAEWCREMYVTWYSGAVVLAQETAYPTAAHWTVQKRVEGFDKVTVELGEPNLAGHFIKVQRIEIGQTIWFLKEELTGVQLVNEIDPTLSDLTVDTMQVHIQDKVGRGLIPQKNQKLELYRDDALMAVQYIESSTREGKSHYTFTCQSAIGLLEDDYLGGIYDSDPVTDVVDDILGGFSYELHSKYRQMTVSGYLPICTRRQALQQLAFALGAVVTTQGSDRIRLLPLETAISGVFKKEDIFQGGSMEMIPRVARLEVVAHRYARSLQQETLLENESISGSDVLVTFDAPHHSYAITGGTLTGSGANWVRITADGEVTLTGKPYLHSTTRYIRSNPDALPAERNNVKLIEDATLIHHRNAAGVLDRMDKIAQLRQTLTQEVAVSGQHAGHRVTSESPWDGQVCGYITAMESELTQNGHTAQITLIGTQTDMTTAVGYAGELFAGDKEVLYGWN